jgi:tellurite resistance protein
MLRSVVAMAAIDGTTEVTEMAAMVRLCKDWGLPTTLLKEAVREAKAGKAQLVLPKDPRWRQALFGGLLRVSIADGIVQAEERTLLRRVGAHFGWTQEQVDGLISGASGS